MASGRQKVGNPGKRDKLLPVINERKDMKKGIQKILVKTIDSARSITRIF